jgi:hypothetical protein
MPFDSRDYNPVVNDWFEREIKYEGEGVAEFDNPKGWVKGHSVVHVAETGKFHVKMDVDEFECQKTLGLDGRLGDLEWLLTGKRPQVVGGMSMSSISSESANVCSKLEIQTEDGIFSVADKSIRFNSMFDDVHFYPTVAYFGSRQEPRAKYWVLPLSNFAVLCPPLFGYHPIYRHPLRFHIVPVVPEGLIGRERQEAYLLANGRNNLIVFKFGRGLAFIEPLPDFSERKRKLENCEACNLITAVMVGRTGNRSLDFPEAIAWLPIDAIHLLTLASGHLVGSAWIEFRAANGNLVRRIHLTNLWQANFQKGHAAIGVHQIGRLLSQAPQKLSPNLRVAIRHLVKGTRKGLGTEDNLSYLVRAIDTLCEPLKSPPYDPAQFDAARWQQVQKEAKSAGDAIRQIARKADASGNETEAECEKLIADRISSAANTSRRLQMDEAMSVLLQWAGLHDAAIVEQHFLNNPRPDGVKTLPQVVSMYRGRTIHESYFMFSDGTHNIEDVGRIQRHLTDILLRVILKNLGYAGEYRSVLAPGDKPLDWVTPSTSAEQLGY